MSLSKLSVAVNNSAATQKKIQRSMSIEEVLSLPSPSWAIRDLLPACGLVILHGEPAAGKTFLALDWCMSLARGEDWNGHKTLQTGVLYIAGEGVAGLGVRLRAYIRSRGMRPGTRLKIIPAAIDFPKSVDGLLYEIDCIKKETGWEVGVVVLDTLARTAGGLDENSSQMADYIRATDELISRGMLVIVLHHPGKDSARGMRGWSGLRGAADTEIELTVASDGSRKVEWKKQKDSEIPKPIGFRLQTIETGERDDEGRPIKSCVVVTCDPALQITRARPRGSKQMLLYSLLGEMLKASPLAGKGGAPDGRPCVLLEEVFQRWRKAVPSRGRELQYFQRTLDGLTRAGFIKGDGEWLWTP